MLQCLIGRGGGGGGGSPTCVSLLLAVAPQSFLTLAADAHCSGKIGLR